LAGFSVYLGEITSKSMALKGVKTLDDVPPVLDVPAMLMFDWRQL